MPEPYCDFTGGYCEWIAYGANAAFKFHRTTPQQSAEAGEAGPPMDVNGGNTGYAVVALGNTAAAETQPSMFYGPPSMELWENRTYCFQFKMQMQVRNWVSRNLFRVQRHFLPAASAAAGLHLTFSIPTCVKR